MRRFAILAAIGGMALCGSTIEAAFVVTTSRSAITTGTFAGDDGVTLFIQNNGVGTTDPSSGANIAYYDVSVSSAASNPKFFIHTWNGTFRSSKPAMNTEADFGYQGFLQGDANRDGQVSLADFGILAANFGKPTGATWEQADFNGDGQVTLADFGLLASNFGSVVNPASYVRFGGPAQFDAFFPLGLTTSETSQTYTDGQAVTGFEVASLVLVSATQAYLSDSAPTQVAYAVVPTGQAVTFSGSAFGTFGPSNTFSITDSGGALMPAGVPVPEPASIGLLACAGILLRRRR